eukprot:1382088-Pyramimonas_sp.AAC.1
MRGRRTLQREARSRGHSPLLITAYARKQPAGKQPKSTAKHERIQEANQPSCQQANRQEHRIND